LANKATHIGVWDIGSPGVIGFGNLSYGAYALQYHVGPAGENVAIGHGALGRSENGFRNTAIGNWTGYRSKAGDHNVWVGQFAGEVSGVTLMNTGVGADNLRGLKDGNFNTSVGGFGLYRTTSAVDYVTITNGGSGYTTATCTFSAPDVGSPGAHSILATGTVTINAGVVTGIVITNPGSGYSVSYTTPTVTITGDGVGATGTVTLKNPDGNTSLGYSAGFTNETGDYNTYIGYFAGYRGDFNPPVGGDDDYSLLIGYNANRDTALPASTKLTNAGAIGKNAVVSASNTLILGGTGADQINVGIGATTARKYLDVVGSDILVHELTVGRGGASISTNTVVGTNALLGNTTGANNVAIGYNNSPVVTTSSNFVSIGSQAMANLKNGTYSVAIGYKAMESVSGTNIQRYSVAIGAEALKSANATGQLFWENNVAIGYQSLMAMSTGFNNTMVGWWSGRNMITGDNNVGVGAAALMDANGQYLTGVGINALANATGIGNISLGYYSGFGCTSGEHNLFLGYRAGYGTSTGSYNVLVGDNSGNLLTSESYNVILGANTGTPILGLDNHVLISDGQGNQRLLINNNGAYSIGGGYGSAGQVLTSNGSGAAPTWQAAGSSVTTDSFNATTDWGSPSGGYYSYTFTHSLATNDYLIQIWDDTGTPVEVQPTIEQTTNNSVTLKVTDAPDNRFAGRIIIIA